MWIWWWRTELNEWMHQKMMFVWCVMMILPFLLSCFSSHFSLSLLLATQGDDRQTARSSINISWECMKTVRRVEGWMLRRSIEETFEWWFFWFSWVNARKKSNWTKNNIHHHPGWVIIIVIFLDRGWRSWWTLPPLYYHHLHHEHLCSPFAMIRVSLYFLLFLPPTKHIIHIVIMCNQIIPHILVLLLDG